jgi:hypothetical protein
MVQNFVGEKIESQIYMKMYKISEIPIREIILSCYY